jgi:hypothetical protein
VRIWKETITAYLELSSRYLTGDTKGNFWLKFKAGSSHKQSRNAHCHTTTFSLYIITMLYIFFVSGMKMIIVPENICILEF